VRSRSDVQNKCVIGLASMLSLSQTYGSKSSCRQGLTNSFLPQSASQCRQIVPPIPHLSRTLSGTSSRFPPAFLVNVLQSRRNAG